MADDFTFDVDAFNQTFMQLVPHLRALGCELVSGTPDPAVAVMRLPWDERFVGNPETGVVHGGVITTLIDSVCGTAVFLKLRQPLPIATLDLRIDYMKPATPRRAVLARAECLKVTRNVAFTRALAYHDDERDPVASAAATFMLSTAGAVPVAREAVEAVLKEGGA